VGEGLLSGGSRGPGWASSAPPPLILGKTMSEGRKAGRADKTKPGPCLSAGSGSATAFVRYLQKNLKDIFHSIVEGLHLGLLVQTKTNQSWPPRNLLPL